MVRDKVFFAQLCSALINCREQTTMSDQSVDQTGYNAHYGKSSADAKPGKKRSHRAMRAKNPEDYVVEFESRFLRPFCESGTMFDGEELALAISHVLKPGIKNVVDAGSGRGTLSVYLACKGLNVVGVEISEEGVRLGNELANQVGVQCKFVAASLDNTGEPDNHFDAVIGRHSLHHLIKYEAIPAELRRITKDDAIAVFVDPFGENFFRRPFQNRKLMEELGDTLLTKPDIERYFEGNSVHLQPSAWFTKLDKLFVRALGRKNPWVHRLAPIWHKIDQLIPTNRATLWLSGIVVTKVQLNSR